MDNVTIDACSDATREECESLIGKTVAKIDAGEGTFTITFTDDSSVELSGWMYGDCALGVNVEPSLTPTVPRKQRQAEDLMRQAQKAVEQASSETDADSFAKRLSKYHQKHGVPWMM